MARVAAAEHLDHRDRRPADPPRPDPGLHLRRRRSPRSVAGKRTARARTWRRGCRTARRPGSCTRTRLARRRQRVALVEGLRQAVARYGIGDVTVEDPFPVEGFRNFQAWFNGRELDITAAFQEFAEPARGVRAPRWRRSARVDGGDGPHLPHPVRGRRPDHELADQPDALRRAPRVRGAPLLAGDPRRALAVARWRAAVRVRALRTDPCGRHVRGRARSRRAAPRGGRPHPCPRRPRAATRRSPTEAAPSRSTSPRSSLRPGSAEPPANSRE